MNNIGLVGVVENDTVTTEKILLGIIKHKVKHKWTLFSLDKIDKFLFNSWDVERQKIDALILFYDAAGLDKFPSLKNVPRVEICPDSINADVHTITYDDYQIGRAGAEHLLFCGYNFFAFAGCSGKLWSLERKQGFFDRLKEEGIDTVGSYDCSWTGWFSSPNYGRLLEWLKSLKYNTGIFVANDHMASIVLQQCKGAGKSVPDAAGVLGVNNDIICCESFSPPISTLALDLNTLGSAAARMVQNLIDHKEQDKILRLSMQNLILRESTKINEDRHIAQAIKLIHNHYSEGITVNEICDFIPASRTVLFKKFKKITGLTMHGKIMQVKLENAAYLLKYSSLLVGDISLECGFKNTQRFSEAFKKVYSISPGEFRKHYL